MLQRSLRALATIEKAVSSIAAFFMFAIMIIVFSDVVMRYAFNRPFSWAYDLISLYLMAGIFFLILSEAYASHAHVSVDILQQTSALRAAIDSVALLILEDHVQGCVKTAAEQGDADQYIEEVLDVVRRALGKPVRPRV